MKSSSSDVRARHRALEVEEELEIAHAVLELLLGLERAGCSSA